MKTTNNFASILVIAGMLISNIVTAQNNTTDLTSETNVTNLSFVASPPDKIPIPVNEKSIKTPLMIMDGKNKMIRLNYALPSFTYSAILLIQDFTGRTLKTFNVNIHNADANEFYINDLLSDTYHYTLVLDNQKKVTGEFIVKE